MDREAWRALVAEAVGTFLFFFVGAGSILATAGVLSGGGGSPDLVAVAFAHGLVLAVLVSSFGAISGGHFNPAVTLGVWLVGRIPTVRALWYVWAQAVGALGAGVALFLVFGDAGRAAGLGVPALGAGVTPLVGIGVEAVLTMVLLFAVFGTAIDPRAPKIGGLAIGLAIGADILMGGPLTGAAMNPARWLGPAVVAGNFSDWYVWWIGPLAGAAIAALIYRFLLPAAPPPGLPAAERSADLDRAPGSPTA
jgi:aquaporin Z